MSPAERERQKRRIERAQEERKKQLAEQHRKVAVKANRIWERSAPAPDDHPYLQRKGVKAHGLRLDGDRLVVPVRIDGEIASIQWITPDGGKQFMPGGAVAGGYYAMGKPAGRLFIVEGFATGATVREATGDAVAVSFNAGNLEPVATAIRAKLPDVEIVVAGDHDESRTGETKGRAAAGAVGGRFIMPPDVGMDWNDYAAKHGLEATREAITSQVNETAQQVKESAPNLPDNPLDGQLQPDGETEPETFDEMVERLARMKPHEYDQVRKATAKLFEVRTSTLDAAVEAVRKREQSTQSFFAEIEPWDDPVDGRELVTLLAATIRRFVCLPKHADLALALWVLNTFVHDASYFSPMIVLTSPDKRCGKTTLMNVLGALCRWVLAAGSVTEAVVFRAIELWHPTLMIDEVDTFLNQNEGLAGVINSGHTKPNARVLRCDGDNNEPKAFSTWCPKVLAGIGRIRGTLEDRSIIIQMRRKLTDEKVERLRLDRGGFGDIQRKCQRWADDHFDAVQEADPTIPSGLHDRAADNWTPLLAIADLCGVGDEARLAALAISECLEDDSIDTVLLKDIRDIFGRLKVSRLSSQKLCEHLVSIDDRPWGEWSRGRPITPNKLAGRLKAFGIHPKTTRLPNGDRLKGYELEAFKDAFSRYIPPSNRDGVTTAQNQRVTENSNRDKKNRVTEQKTLKPLVHNDCHGVTVQTVPSGEKEKNGTVVTDQRMVMGTI